MRTAMTKTLTLFAGLVLLALPPAVAAERALPLSVSPAFAGALDLEAFRLAAVQDDGRLKTVDSLAREKLHLVNRSRAARAVDPVLLLLDLVLAPEHYVATNVIEIHKPAFRRQLVQTIRGMVPPEQRSGLIAEIELRRIEMPRGEGAGLVSPAFLDHPAVRSALAVLERDLMRTSKEVGVLGAARAYADSHTLLAMLHVMPRPGAREIDPWMSLHDVVHGHEGHGGPHGGAMPAAQGLPPALGGAITGSVEKRWADLQHAWHVQDAALANTALAGLAADFAGAAPALYPSVARRSWEHWYYRHDKLTAGWIIYFFALPFLLMATVYGFRWARLTGLALFAGGLLLHTFSLGLRWWLAGRIPNANMFEAITASAWFGGVVALVLEYVLRRWPVRNLPALAASAYAMLALMCGRFLPILLPGTFHSDIGQVMPVLDRTVWLYIHTNMIIASYALIFFASVTALLYLVFRAAVAVANSPRLAALWGGAAGPAAVRGGASSIIMGRGIAPGEARDAGLARSLDGATMIFLELGFLTLWFGTILGAVWAYFSWGRPWGWDPKEVFALNTWLVLLVLVHIRLKVKDKALWTALLALLGCAVMLFNWVAVNFVIVGLHSYA